MKTRWKIVNKGKSVHVMPTHPVESKQKGYTMVNIIKPEIPQEIIDAAKKITMWADKNGHSGWRLMGICDRLYAENLDQMAVSVNAVINISAGCECMKINDIEFFKVTKS